jgi:regulator of protease activity HflC (stomatin/prohibitin superfamily)
MGGAFEWLGKLMDALLAFLPRRIIVRATQRGIRWRFGRNVKELKPGWYIYWPLISEVEVIVAARQTNSLPRQDLMTRDGIELKVKAIVAYSVDNAALAIGEQNWDVDTTVNDITQATIASAIAAMPFNQLLEEMASEALVKKLTKAARDQLRSFGVKIDRVRITDLHRNRAIRFASPLTLLTGPADAEPDAGPIPARGVLLGEPDATENIQVGT